MILTLDPGRGSPLWQAPPGGITIELIEGALSGVAGILGDRYFASWPRPLTRVGHPQPFMLVNAGDVPARFLLSPLEEFPEENVIYDPYRYEENPPPVVDPGAFRRAQPGNVVPSGFTSTLAKWYSVKFSYPGHNLIFVRPGLGISFQVHAHRGEHWEIITGSPTILAGAEVFHGAQPGDAFDLPQGMLHSVINPGEEWAGLRETWSGHFDEQDISRVFNPNHYEEPS